jgi:hypothetical protein
MIPAIFFAGPRSNGAAQLRKPSIEDQQLFRFNRREHKPHAHPGFEVDHHGRASNDLFSLVIRQPERRVRIDRPRVAREHLRQPRGFLHRQRMQKDRVDNRENCRVP